MTATEPGRAQACWQAVTRAPPSEAAGTRVRSNAPGSARSEEAGLSSGAIIASSVEA